MPGHNDLWVTFKLDGDDYCVQSRCIEAMTIPAEVRPMPNNPDHMLGVMRWNGTSIPVVDMRTLLGMPTLAQAIDDFAVMRQMHLDWIQALEDSVRNHTQFTKAVDPHQCKFGKWFDSFKTDNISLNFILNKIGAPHEYVHRHGAEVQKCMAVGDWEGSQKKYEEAYEVCTTQVLPLLDELIETYREVNHGIAIVIKHEGRNLGLMVDEIDTLIPAGRASVHPVPPALGGSSETVESLVLYGDKTLTAIDVDKIASYVESKEEQAKEIASQLALSKGDN